MPPNWSGALNLVRRPVPTTRRQGATFEAMIRLWGRRTSFNVQKVLWLLAELDLPFQHLQAGGVFGGLDAPEFLTLNPHGRIPVLEDRGVAIWESHAILRYLAASYGSEMFWAADPAVRALREGWMDWAQTALQPAFHTGVFWGYYRTPEEERDWAAIHESLTETWALCGRLDAFLAHRPFLAGDELSLADIPAGGLLYRYHELDIERPDLPNLTAWYERLKGRPAYRTAVMVPFGEFKGRLTY